MGVADLREALVLANRMLANEGIFRIFGHISCRHPDGDKLLISRARSPALVTEDDIVTMNFDGEVLNADVRPYGETVIHRSIYRERDDVNAIVHHHADEIMPFTALDIEYKPVFHMAALFADGVPTFSDFDTEGGRLVVTEAEGERLAENLGDHRAQFVAGHGANVIGFDLREVVTATTYFVLNARYQYQMELFGEPTYYTGPVESVRTMVDDVLLSDLVLDRVWEHLAAQVTD
ncbi:class II aldolase/adducin family protein [Halobellus rufus]|uniref:class II aldolase/adducin family protein n=1 Tax=Halobellus rufus TaxID=1448860 RepID=UPI0006795BD5|nr:class II aldolase/adducin family protein [Halobellus rufus]